MSVQALHASTPDFRNPGFREFTSTFIFARMRPTPLAHSSPVRRARERAGLSREQLAVKAGLSSTTLYLAERAKLISPRTAERLAVALGVTAEELQS